MSKASVISNVRKLVLPGKAAIQKTAELVNPIVYTDGSCLSQGLPNARAGYGVFWDENHPNNQFGRVPGLQNNHRSEIFAVYQAVNKAIGLKYTKITVLTDSEYVLYVFENLAKCKKPDTFNRDLHESIRRKTKRIEVDIEKVKAHSGVYGNEQADRIARAGAREKQKTV